MKKIPVAKELPDSSSFPRYVAAGQSITDCPRDSRGKAVRLTSRCWIGTARWNEIAEAANSFDAAKKTALAEAHSNRASGKAKYATILQRLDALEHPGFQSRRTALAIHAAQIA